MMLNSYPDYRLFCFDKLTYASNLDALNYLVVNKDITFINGDIANKREITLAVESNEIDLIVNFAAETHVDRSIEAADDFISTNIVGVFNLLEILKKKKTIRFHHVSTDEVYGDLPIGTTNDSFREDSLIRPSSPYAASKAAADLLVRSYQRTYNLNTTISNCSNNYGPYQHPEKLIPKTIISAIKDQKIPVYGNGQNVRDWMHVDDHCRAIDLIIHHGKIGSTYNIGANNELSNLDLINRILHMLSKPLKLIEFVDDRLGHDRRYSVDSSLIRSELDWKPKVDFVTGLSKTINWYLSKYTNGKI